MSERSPSRPWSRRRRGPVSRRGRWRQAQALRVAAALLLGVAVWLVTSALLPHSQEPGLPTVVLARDLPSGAVLAAGDLHVAARPEADRPSGVVADLAEAVGQVLSGPVLAGEMVTTARFRGPGLLTGQPPGALAVSLPVADLSLLGSLRPGDAVSVLAGGTGQTLVPSATVLLVEGAPQGGLSAPASESRHVLVAATAEEVRLMAATAGPDGAGGSVTSLLVALRR